MKSMHEVSAREVMNSKPPKVEKNSSIGSVRDFMEKENLRAVAVEQNGDYEGVISYRELIRHAQFSSSAKLEKVIHNAPEFDPSDSIIDVAKLRVESGRKLLVNIQNGSLEAAISDQEFLEFSSKVKEFENYSTRNLATHEVLTIFEEDSVDKARHKMLDNSISRLPVLDSEGRLTGVLRSTDLLKILVEQESQNSGGTSGKSLKDTQIAGGGEKESMSNINVQEIMGRDQLTIEGFVNVTEAVNKMNKKEKTDIIITDSGYPEAILTVKDLVNYLADQAIQDYMLVNLVGVETDEEKAAIHNKVEKQLKGSLGRKIQEPEEISIHLKKKEKDGKRHRYEIIAKIYSEYGITTSTVEEWDLIDAVDLALDELNSQLRKQKEKSSEHH